MKARRPRCRARRAGRARRRVPDAGGGRARRRRAQPHLREPETVADTPRHGCGRALHRVLPRGPRSLSRAGRRGDGTFSTTPWRCSTPRVPGAADDVERVLRQRAALLRQVGGRSNPGPEILTTLDVWDQRLADAAKILVAAREAWPPRSHPGVAATYGRLAGNQPVEPGRGRRRRPGPVAVHYQRSWEGRPAGGPGGEPGRRPAAGRQHGRDRTVTTSSCASTGGRRAPTRPGRAALPGVGPAPQPPRRRPGAHDPASDAAPRRRLLRARPGSAAGRWWRSSPPGQAILTTASPVPSGVTVASLVEVGDLVPQ